MDLCGPEGGEHLYMIRNDHVLTLNSADSHSIVRPAARRERTAVIASVGSAFPDRSYSQDEVGALLGLENQVVKKLLRSPHIQKRHLYLPDVDPSTGRLVPESAADLHAKFREGALEVGSRAIRNALGALSLSPGDVGYLMCV